MVNFFLQFLYFGLRLYYTNLDSQRLASAMFRSAKIIQDIVINDAKAFEHVDETMEYEVRKLCQDMRASHPICPFNLFSTNLSTLLNVLSTALTYVIVLMQLKFVELPLKA